jgi:hypothetical protein
MHVCSISNLKRIGAVVIKKLKMFKYYLALYFINFGRGLPALYRHAFSFSYIYVVSEKEMVLKTGQF